jgi:hypothetical protein
MAKKIIAIDIQDSYNKLHNNVKDTFDRFQNLNMVQTRLYLTLAELSQEQAEGKGIDEKISLSVNLTEIGKTGNSLML